MRCPNCQHEFSPAPSLDLDGEGKEQKKARRWPKGQAVPQKWKDWAKAERPLVDVELQAKLFVDFWIAKSGKDATKLDWAATWRTWIRQCRVDPKAFVPPKVNPSPQIREPNRTQLTPEQRRANAERIAQMAGTIGRGQVEDEPKTIEEALKRSFAKELGVKA